MKRDYHDGVKDDVVYFIGTEVEHTPAYGLRTLFVTGVQPINEIMEHYHANHCEHIYLGANQSFNPGNWQNDDHYASDAWDRMIKDALLTGELVTLDFDVAHVEWVHECCYSEYNNFIAQISVKIPYISLFNYNTMVKIDDRDFKATNIGVWCHSLHDLQDRKTFTPWSEYTKDIPI